MARGFESKSVADQQAEAEDRRRTGVDPTDAERTLKRRRLELSRSDVLQHLKLAKAEGHREMLRRALAALDEELARLR